MARGGSRAGAGRPKGSTGIPQAQTLSKEAAREVLRQRVLKDLEPLVSAQIANATGLSHFMLRNPETGQWSRLTDPAQIEMALNAEGAAEGSTYFIWTKDPSVQAFTDLMNRCLDKPREQMDVVVTGELELVQRLASARARVKK